MLAFSSAFSVKSDFYVRTGSSGIVQDNISEDDWSFGGLYSTWNGSVTLPELYNAKVVAKVKLKLSSSDTFDDMATSASWEKAWISFSLPVFQPIQLYGGKGFALVQPGSFFSLLEEYSDGSRWGKDGFGLTVGNDFFTYGLSFTINSTSSADLKDNLQLGSGLTLDFEKYQIPVKAGLSLIYDNGKNYDSRSEQTLSTKTYTAEDGSQVRIYETTTVYDYGNLFTDERDYTPSIFIQANPMKGFTVSSGYSLNASALTTSSTFKRVANYKTPDLYHSHLLTLISKLKFQGLAFEEEAEWAKSFDGDYYSIYGGLRSKIHLGGIFYGYPAVQYYKIFNGSDSSVSRDSLVLYPRLILEKGSHYFVIGTSFEHREVKENSYQWNFKLPLYYKLTL